MADDGESRDRPIEDNFSTGFFGITYSRLLGYAFLAFITHIIVQKLGKNIKLQIAIETEKPESRWKTLSRNMLKGLANEIENVFTAMEDGIAYKVFLYWTDETKPEVRRFCMEKGVGISGYMNIVKAKLQDLYPKLKNKLYTIAWKDEDEDEVLMSTDDEVSTMLNNLNDNVIKLYVRINGERENEDDDENDEAEASAIRDAPAAVPLVDNGAVVRGVMIYCNACGGVVTGYRYKCITCDSYDLCMRCEADGKHPDHCVVRMPACNMSLPLIKASIKKSRKFLKSVASQVNEENKRLRRERSALRRDANAAQSPQGKKDSKPRVMRSWVDIFSTYMEEFTNLAGDLTRMAGPEATNVSEAGPSTANPNVRAAPTTEEIYQNPWDLPKQDLEKLQDACQILRDNAVSGSIKTFNKVLSMVASVAEDATALSPPQCPQRATTTQLSATSPVATTPTSPTPPARATSPQTSEHEVPSTSAPKTQQVATSAQEVVVRKQEATNPLQVAKANKHAIQNIQNEQQKLFEERIRDLIVRKDDERQAEIVLRNIHAKVAQELAKTNGAVEQNEENEDPEVTGEVSSNASSSGSEKGWTVLDELKDELEAVNETMSSMYASDPFQHRTVKHASLYPPLNAATAVLDPQESVTASAPPLPTQAMPADRNPAQAKPTQAMPAQAMPTQAKPAQTMPTQAMPPKPRLAAHIQAAVEQMEAMGFSNESQWLTQLLISNDGNIATVLDLITPTHK